MSDIEFVDGLIVKAPHPNAPDFVKLKISINRKSLGNWLRAKDDEWINVDVKESREGKLYASVDTWQPDTAKVPPDAPQAAPEGFDDKIPDAFDPDVPFADPYKINVYCF